MKLVRAIDPFTQTVAIVMVAAFAIWYAWQHKSSGALWVAGGLTLFGAYKLLKLQEEKPALFNDHGFEGDGVWFGPNADWENVLQQDISMVASTIKLDGKSYQIADGTHAYINPDGKVKNYSPFSALRNGLANRKTLIDE